MNKRVFIGSVLLGILCTLACIAFQWRTADYHDVSVGVSGPSTTLSMGPISGGIPVGPDTSLQTTQLMDYLQENNLWLVFKSDGQGFPNMLAYDPNHMIKWLPISNSGDLYLFKNTYAERVWRSTGNVPFLLEGLKPEGVLPAPRGLLDLQYLQVISPETVLSQGSYTVGTASNLQVTEIEKIFKSLGLRVYTSRSLPLLEYLKQDPLVGITTFLYALGIVATAVHWAALKFTFRKEILIRFHHGASMGKSVRKDFFAALAAACTGAFVGCILLIPVVIQVGKQSLSSTDVQAISVAIVISTVLGGMTLFVSLLASISASLRSQNV